MTLSNFEWDENFWDDKSQIALKVNGKIKNIYNKRLDLSAETVELLVNNTYTYKGSMIGDSYVDPLVEADFDFLITVPKEVREIFQHATLIVGYTDLLQDKFRATMDDWENHFAVELE